MTSLPGLGLISYNGLEFAGPMVNSRASIEPIRGDDDRSVVYHKLTIEIHAIVDIEQCGVQQSELTGTTYLSMLDKIRYMLSQDGQSLKFEDKIFGRLHVNTGGSNYYDLIDVDFGPRVRLGSITPIVSNKTFEIVWSVTAAIGQCPEYDGGDLTGGFVKSWAQGDVKQFVYAVSWSSDYKGYTSRTVSGFIEIVLAPALSANFITTSADDYRESLTVAIPYGFRRVANDWTLNEKRDRINFVIRDEEIHSPSPFPADVVDISVSHRVAVGLSSAFQRATATLSGYCEVANGCDTVKAWERLYPIMMSRIESAISINGAIMVIDVVVDEDIYARTVHVEILYQKLGTSPMGFIASAGLFTPVTDTWSDWRTSMYGPSDTENSAGLPWSRRSVANLSYDPSDDLIVTPCTSQPLSLLINNQNQSQSRTQLRSYLSNVCPPRDKSYLSYKSSLRSDVRGGAYTFVEMPTRAMTYTPRVAQTSDGVYLSSGVNSGSQSVRVVDSSTSGQMLQFVLEGKARRLGYAPEIPQIAANWGQSVQKVPNGSMIQTTSVMYLGCRLYSTKWKIKYAISESLVASAGDVGTLATMIFATGDYPLGDQGDIE